MRLFYKSERIGQYGKLFTMYKIKTLRDGVDKTSSFVDQNQYLLLGKFLRKSKLDELPQLWNLIKGDLALVGPRAEEAKTINALPEATRKILLSVKPGLTSLASVQFFNEGQLLEQAKDPYKLYWTAVKPLKITLDAFYIENRDLLLDAWIVWKTAILIIKSFFKKWRTIRKLPSNVGLSA